MCQYCKDNALTYPPDDPNDQYCDEVNDLVDKLYGLEVAILTLISKNRLNYSLLQKIRSLIEQILGQLLELSETIIIKQYYYGITGAISYSSNRELSIRESLMIEELYAQLEEELTTALNNSYNYLYALIYGIMRQGLNFVDQEANKQELINILKNTGIIAHTDVSGKKWQISTYGEMVIKTSSRQSTNIGILFEDLDHDLYMVSAHATACPICIPYENRVFSRDGTNSNYPNIGLLFGIKDQSLPVSLENSYLNIHPNCKHFLIKFYESEHTEDDLERIRRYSGFNTNPVVKDQAFERRMQEYRKTQYAKRKILNDKKQHMRYRLVLGDYIPKSFNNFEKIKYNNPSQYKEWMKLYREMVKNVT